METLRQIQQFSVLFAPGVNKKAYDHAFLFGEIYERAEFLALILGCDAPIFRSMHSEAYNSCCKDGVVSNNVVYQWMLQKRKAFFLILFMKGK